MSSASFLLKYCNYHITKENVATIYSNFSVLPISRRGSKTSHFRSDLKNIETCCKAISEKQTKYTLFSSLKKKKKRKITEWWWKSLQQTQSKKNKKKKTAESPNLCYSVPICEQNTWINVGHTHTQVCTGVQCNVMQAVYFDTEG